MNNNATAVAALVVGIFTMVLVIAGGAYLIFAVNQTSEPAVVTERVEVPVVQDSHKVPVEEAPKLLVTSDSDFRHILSGYDSARNYLGVAEIEGYFTTVQRALEWGDDPPMTDCAAFRITDGPDEVVEYAKKDSNGFQDGMIVLGPVDGVPESSWWETPALEDSSPEQPIRAIFRFGSRFEGGSAGCMNPWTEFIGTVPVQ